MTQRRRQSRKPEVVNRTGKDEQTEAADGQPLEQLRAGVHSNGPDGQILSSKHGPLIFLKGNLALRDLEKGRCDTLERKVCWSHPGSGFGHPPGTTFRRPVAVGA